MKDILKRIHNVDTWFGSDDNQSLLNYFENTFSKNTIGEFKAQHSVANRFNDLQTQDDKAKLINALGNIFIDGLLGSPKGYMVKQIPFTWLEDDTKFVFKESLCEAIQHCVLNNQIWEKINSSNVSTPDFTISSDSTSWLLTADIFGQYYRVALSQSGIETYEWVEENVLWQNTTNGNVKIVGKADKETIKELALPV